MSSFWIGRRICDEIGIGRAAAEMANRDETGRSEAEMTNGVIITEKAAEEAVKEGTEIWNTRWRSGSW